jgi:hypothetical protein
MLCALHHASFQQELFALLSGRRNTGVDVERQVAEVNASRGFHAVFNPNKRQPM